uniref:IS66 family insertion sequence element accessory protein TnpB n=1 Tax=Blautia hansenii TaxID=1322 RepID=UPI0022E1FA7E
MLGDITAADEIYIVTGRTDMRKSIDGLCAIVENQLHMEPRRSALYLFCGKRCDRIKALLWESDGFVLLYKRMEVQGRFRWPRNQLEVKQLTWQQFDWLMSGQRHSNLRNDRVKTLCQPTKMESFPHSVSCLQSLVNTGFSASF